MKVLLANPRGFCAGVYMAIDVVDQLLDVTEGVQTDTVLALPVDGFDGSENGMGRDELLVPTIDAACLGMHHQWCNRLDQFVVGKISGERVADSGRADCRDGALQKRFPIASSEIRHHAFVILEPI